MLAFVFSALVVLLDQFFKRWIVRTIEVSERVDLIPGVIGLTHLHNPGAAFGILSGQRWLLATIAFIACLVVVFILLRYTEGFWGTLGLSAVLGGAVGNLVDRILYGYVVDMFETLFVRFAIFNIADIFITLGFATFCIHFIKLSVRQAREENEEFENARVGMDGDDFDDYHEDDYEDDYIEESEQYADPYEEFEMQSDSGEIPDYEEFDDAPVVAPDMDTDPDLSEIREHIEAAQEQGYNYKPAHMQTAVQEQPTQPIPVHEYSEPVTRIEPSKPPAPVKHSKPVEHSAPVQSPDDGISALEALSALELELGAVDDYDVDAMLREYGFEDSAKGNISHE